MHATPSPPSEFDLPLSGNAAWGGPDGIGDSRFDDVPAPTAVELPPELGDDPRIALRRTLGMFATGVTIITTRGGDQVHGMTANAFMSVSLEPPLVLISVDKRAKMCALLHEGRSYGVSVLCEAQRSLSDRFAGRPNPDAPEPGFEVVHDTPLVAGALAHFRRHRHPLLLGRRPLPVPRARWVRALLRGHAAAVPRRPLRAAGPGVASARGAGGR
jgi:hypothetical protein